MALTPRNQRKFNEFEKDVKANPDIQDNPLHSLGLRYGVSHETIRRWRERLKERSHIPNDHLNGDTVITDDKKIGSFNYEEAIEQMIKLQEIKRNASSSQQLANINISTKHKKIIGINLADMHLGSFGADYNLFQQYTDLILTHPQVYVFLVGDLTDNFIAFKNQAAIFSQAVSPAMQKMILQGWVEKIQHKILVSTWCNHSEMEEKASGLNAIADVLKAKSLYLDGIGKVNLCINNIVYEIVLTHKTRNFSMFNKTHGLKQLARNDLPLCDLYIAGDRHDPSMETTFLQGKRMTMIQLGSFKTEDAYSRRYFSYSTSPVMPCVVFDTTEHSLTGFWTIDEAIHYARPDPPFIPKK